LIRCLIRAGRIVEPHQLYIITALRRRHIGLKCKSICRYGIIIHGIFLNRSPAVIDEPALELDLIVLPGIILGAGTLDIYLGAGERKGPATVDRIHIGAADCLLIPLVLRKIRAFKDQVRKVCRQL